MDKQILDEHSKIFLEDYTQNFGGVFFHPEDGKDSQLNESLYNIYLDIAKIDDVLVSTGRAVNDLLSNTILRLDEIKKCIISEKERYQDIQMLCNQYTDFDNVNTLSIDSFTGSYSKDGNSIYAPIKKTTEVKLKIIDVNGNGYEGNRYVYNNFEYQKDTYDTSNRDFITDNKINTYYEYSRITINNDVTETNTYFNKDNAKARCTITFEASDLVNYINIDTEDLGISITNIEYSIDNIKYYTSKLPSKLTIKDKLDSYKNYGYIYGSGILAVPLCKYFRITFETDRDKEDVIAYEKTLFDDLVRYAQVNVNHLTGTFDIEEQRVPVTNTSTYIVEGAKRSAIKINNISAYNKSYSQKTQIITDELISADGFSISVFANVYVPEGLDDDAVKFTLIINGINYEVVPINSNSNGIKVIRFSGGKSSTIYTQLISEKIKSAKLAITFNCKSDTSPYVNNIKVLIGGEV
jgi:hypothetical protein